MSDRGDIKDYKTFFQKANGSSDRTPFRFQEQFATAPDLPRLVNVPTGAGKTAMAVLGWLWRRRFADEATRQATPRRLVYCLPMRVLVEQTRDNTIRWLHNLDLLAGKAEFEDDSGNGRLKSYVPNWKDPEKIAVTVLMGGEDRDDWDLYPERDAIVIGTQDMLLSRALNRGYGMSRYRWPMHFGLLHNDALWVYDEIQLMGSGLATTSQLEAFRAKFGTTGPAHSVWMSATLDPTWLRTVDLTPPDSVLKLTEQDIAQSKDLSDRFNADKMLDRAASLIGDGNRLAREILDAHQPASRTLVVVNTVDRAVALYEALVKQANKANSGVTPDILHSRFRPADRAERVDRLLAPPAGPGTIIVSTQVVEAGVDVSAKTLFTELAPWASLVQRFGRCNRLGHDSDAKVYWIDWPDDADDKKKEAAALPYSPDDLAEARRYLVQCNNVGPAHLPTVTLRHEHTHVIRRKDFVELFDTTPDLAGNDIDVGRYVREIDDLNVQVFWRDLAGEPPPDNEPFPRREELCSVRIGAFKDFLARLTKKPPVKRWRPYHRNYLERKWEIAGDDAIYPGQVLMLDSAVGGYDSRTGWSGRSDGRVTSLRPEDAPEPEGMDDDPLSQAEGWQSIARHTDLVCAELNLILAAVTVPETEALRFAARWHDRGKRHKVFQDAVRTEHPLYGPRPTEWRGRSDIGKTPKKKRGDPGWWRPYTRKHFRHELASALAVLDPSCPAPDPLRDLIAYLIACHHGKVRLSIRSLPDETKPHDEDGKPQSDRRFARGIWEGESMEPVDLGDGGPPAPLVTLSLELMELGLGEHPPFVGQPSWAERVLALRDRLDLGPFRLSYLETLLRAADWRASDRKPNPPEAAHA